IVQPIKLKPPEGTVYASTLKRSKLAVFPATIVFFSSSGPTLLKTAQPGCRDPSAAVLAVTVLWFNVIVLPPTLERPPLATASAAGVPAPGVAELPLTVLFSRVTVPFLLAMPPPSPVPPAALFPLTVHLSKFAVPKSFAIPPPRALPPALLTPPVTELLLT